jgi:predicted metal-binding membrane protein
MTQSPIRLTSGTVIAMGAMAGITCMAWMHNVHMATTMLSPLSIPVSTSSDWSVADLVFNFGMWTVMMIGMMLPSVTPWVWTLSGWRQRRSINSLCLATSFLAGYLICWTGFSALATLFQEFLRQSSIMTDTLMISDSYMAGSILAIAGIYQLTPLRARCLKHCRSPLSFFMSAWKPGNTGAFNMGAVHGLYCISCCWALMMLSFVTGVMNLIWMAAITLYILVDHAFSVGIWPSRISGALLIVSAVWVLGF